jgi:MacB-like periplasmic core domain/FtsX-like permease family
VLGVVWYRFRVTFGRRRGGYLAVVLLVGLAGGVAMGAVAAARRTQASFAVYLASTSPSDLTVLTGAGGLGPGSSAGYDRALAGRISRLPHVNRVQSYAGLDVAVLAPGGAVRFNVMGLPGSVDGEYFGQDRVTIVQGRMADPRRAGEVVIDAKGSPASVHVGSVVPVGFYTSAQEGLPDFGQARIRPYLRLNVRVVGKAVFSRELVQDDIDASLDGGLLFTPALTRQLTRCCVSYTETAVRLDGGARDVAAAEAAIERVLPRGFPVVFYVTSLTEAKAERAIRPESIALGVFGGIAALAALLIAGQVIGRQLRLGAGDLEVLRALGAGPAITVSDQLPGLAGAVAAGSLLAAAVAAGLSPLAPTGLVRPVYPDPGIAFDWMVLGLGPLVLIAGLSAVAVALAYRQAPHRAARRRPPGRPGSAAARAAASSGLPAPAVEGIRFALDPGAGRNAVPARPTILGTALATIVVVATVTFGASLNNLIAHPALYGWNWTYALSPGFPTYIPQQRAAALLDHDPGVAAWTGVYFGTVTIDGQIVPVIGASPHAPVGPPILSGHGLDAPGQVVLGAATLAQLHKHLGDTVDVRTRAAKPARLRIVGTATLPSLGISATLHTEMGTGALLSYQLIPGHAGNPSRSPSAGPNNILVRLRPGANPAAARRTLRRLVPGDGGSVSSVQRPAEIVNYRSMGTTPAFLGAALAAAAVTALGLTLIASVRRRRRDLALLKTLGFTRRQLAAAIAWQSSIAVTAGTIIGVPSGIALGRFLWDLFARQINVVPQPAIPGLPVILISFGALALANIVAAVPSRVAARTPTALLLRAE